MSSWRSFAIVCSLAALSVSGCDDTSLDARCQTITAVMSQADESVIRGRPLLAQTKYDTMASSLFAFYRGSFPLYLYDAENQSLLSSSAFAVAGLFPISIGDAHPENFGTMRALDGTFALEPNDFDAADRYPYLWELRRLAIGMVVATRSSNPDDPVALAAARADERQIARNVAVGYASAIHDLDGGASPVRVTDGGDSPVLLDIFERSLADAASRSELTTLTTLDETGTSRRLIRGVIDPTDPNNVYEDLPREVTSALPQTVASYRTTLIDPPPPGYLEILDAAREFGAGVASLPKIRIAILVQGPTTSVDDDVILELKELGDSGSPGFGDPPFVADSPEARVVRTSRTVWARPDAEPLWGTSELLGIPVQLKGELDAYKGVKVKRLVKDRGTPVALEGLALRLGELLARMHAAGSKPYPGTLHTIAVTIATAPDRFADEQADVAVHYADIVETDFARFKKVLSVLGPRLGIPFDPNDVPPPDVAALFGTPPPVSP